MATEAVPAGTVADGNGLVLFVPTIADPYGTGPTVAELTATGVKKLTYSIDAGGYTHTITVNKVKVNRLTMAQELQYDGIVTDDISIKYAYTNTVSDIARLALPAGAVGFIVERWAVPNGQAIAAGDIIDVIPIKASIPAKDAPAANAELTRTQTLNVTGPVSRDIPVHA
ncbi:pyruvate carboxylase [Leifsonia xyli subsp. cynodontis DSM 46306]|uniref:Uncharacterized protein n=1 Tax=Leifsonia xyli subsp. cynodontis DSM 46306 TaxID=1389489 RepID=U3P9Q8_LEIXC|nr:hypothetical protein [Leifsonia xyli]AGW41741.1 pyruvate carboxylase [Leifsonia xyli subsp. cynodontis DSM 46306]AGW42264.1 pyruvate carboxylase [Leifsonia xyli subsp. cynodontis DSM 46306]